MHQCKFWSSPAMCQTAMFGWTGVLVAGILEWYITSSIYEIMPKHVCSRLEDMWVVFCSLLSAGAMICACIRYMLRTGSGTFLYQAAFKMHTILITPSCSPLTTLAGAEAVQHTRCSSGAPGHTRTRTRIYTRRRAPLVRATNRGSITDRPHHPARKYLQQRESTAL